MSNWLATNEVLSLDILKTTLQGKFLIAEQRVMVTFSRVVGYFS